MSQPKPLHWEIFRVENGEFVAKAEDVEYDCLHVMLDDDLEALKLACVDFRKGSTYSAPASEPTAWPARHESGPMAHRFYDRNPFPQGDPFIQVAEASVIVAERDALRERVAEYKELVSPGMVVVTAARMTELKEERNALRERVAHLEKIRDEFSAWIYDRLDALHDDAAQAESEIIQPGPRPTRKADARQGEEAPKGP